MVCEIDFNPALPRTLLGDLRTCTNPYKNRRPSIRPKNLCNRAATSANPLWDIAPQNEAGSPWGSRQLIVDTSERFIDSLVPQN